ncbi:penicillin-binding transpeptidase domain-containing protein [Gordonia amicalis]|uniref:penicillin-binding transpeptidase domain-containing protein n=1 Tax=Gordonia amicalis TaxID=89053 RepID=UPI0002A64A30|nr:penicillin-binding transpeptidase domain-containing protein [Gordonia amicalis]MDV7102216.1 penicillin-binding transpeptidase domain-containing protein [Gordonia amicalis]MDV7175612.1 penicillin-binding transpeptidase domain-containing protein [Gordonia amicalis]UKO90764.1 penicillin-binding transpeptidase domain-containing protein [Gordonia amicalis]UOG22283.1 penicillin-binding transpeptidase domain-containing protein [Gordonia amicalis]GAC53331.1 putative penicillin-binding protein [Gord
MWRTRTRWTPAVIVAVCAVVITATAACSSSEDDGPRGAAERFLEAYSQQELDAAAALTDVPQTSRSAMESAWSGLAAEELETKAGRVRVTGDTAEVQVGYTWTLPRGRDWSYDATLRMGRSDAGWAVRWASTAIHPKLGADQRLSLQIIEAPRATVNEADGSEVMVNGTVVGVNFDAGEATEQGASVATSVTSAVGVLRRLNPDLDEQLITEQVTSSRRQYPLARLSHAQFDRLRDQLAIPGVVTNEQAELVPKDPKFAPALLTEVKKVVDGEVAGRAGWRVVSVNPNGLDAAVLADHDPDPSPAVSLSLSRTVQNAAQRAVNATNRFQVAMVVVQPSTGRILAVAQNPAADTQGPIATTGLYPPGSTFKMVTAAAAINRKMAGPDSVVGCPGEVQIGPRLIPNYNGFALGTVSMLQAFAASCNTTFAKLASQMGPSDLAHAAAAMGVGQQYTIAGLDAVSGSVPIENELVARSEDGFGQGKVLVSPLGLALVAATVANGVKTPVPQLILDKPTKVEGPTPTMPPEVYQQLRPMMRAVITSGTASVIDGRGAVFGKTGEAEFEGGSHAWFAGYRGDIAFATLVVRGGDSNNAVAVTRDFFDGLGPGYAVRTP